jgi:hypothetical protein
MLEKRRAENENPYGENVFPQQPGERPLVTPPKKRKTVHRPIPEPEEMRPVRVRRKTVEEEVYTPRFSEESTPQRFLRGLTGVVLSDYGNIAPVSIAQILSTNTANFQARKMRVKCRIHSYLPTNLADFVVAWCDTCQKTYHPPTPPTSSCELQRLTTRQMETRDPSSMPELLCPAVEWRRGRKFL